MQNAMDQLNMPRHHIKPAQLRIRRAGAARRRRQLRLIKNKVQLWAARFILFAVLFCVLALVMMLLAWR